MNKDILIKKKIDYINFFAKENDNFKRQSKKFFFLLTKTNKIIFTGTISLLVVFSVIPTIFVGITTNFYSGLFGLMLYLLGYHFFFKHINDSMFGEILWGKIVKHFTKQLFFYKSNFKIEKERNKTEERLTKELNKLRANIEFNEKYSNILYHIFCSLSHSIGIISFSGIAYLFIEKSHRTDAMEFLALLVIIVFIIYYYSRGEKENRWHLSRRLRDQFGAEWYELKREGKMNMTKEKYIQMKKNEEYKRLGIKD